MLRRGGMMHMRSGSAIIFGVMFMIGSTIGLACARANVDWHNFPDPKEDLSIAPDAGPQTMVLAGGCFWCVEGVFEQIPGVTDVVSGYAGGSEKEASYETVSSGGTNHAEVVQITYDPAQTSYGKLLKIFFSLAHDPTQLNRQGPDYGKQYRSAIFYANDDEKRVAEAYINQLTEAKVFDDPIVTTLEPLEKFYPAEEYHQDFAQRNPNQGYIRQQALPKIEKTKKAVKDMPATQPATRPTE
jgi:peptide-methionine (S)-S-oxide reductase